MQRGAYEFDIEACADSPEQIRKCLNCKKEKCDLCRTNRKSRGVIAMAPDGKTLRFESVTAAATAFSTSKSNIVHAAKRGGQARGFFWRYAEERNGTEV